MACFKLFTEQTCTQGERYLFKCTQTLDLMFRPLFLFVPSLLSLFTACNNNTVSETVKGRIHYRFDSVASEIQLPEELKEISGIKLADTNTFVAIDDNRSALFLVDATTGQTREIKIQGAYRNFEDVEVLGSKIYILQGNGEILELDQPLPADSLIQPVAVYQNKLEDADCEGLFYDHKTQRMLVAYKNYGKDHSYKPIYAFYPANRHFSANPIISLSIADMKESMFHTDFEKFSLKVNEKIKGKKQLFEPSAIAIHPLSSDIYVLSAKNSLLAVYDSKWRLTGVYALPVNRTQQCEGLCFDSAGNIYISNEARSKPANIIKFLYHE